MKSKRSSAHARVFLGTLLVLTLLGLTSTSQAQTIAGGQIVGVVQDPTGAVIPGAQVVVRNVAAGMERTLTTSEVGRYQALNLRSGEYEVTVEQSGFATMRHTGIVLEIGDHTRLLSAVGKTITLDDFELAPVVRALLKSAHFFDAQTVGAHIKSPVEELLGITLELQRAPADPLFEVLFWLSGELGQWVLEPPNVAGWPGHRSWLNTSTLINRWDFAGYMLYDGEEEGLPPHDLKGLAETLHDANDALAIFRLPVALVEHLISIPVEELDIEPLADGFGGDLVSFPIPSEIAAGPVYVRDLAKRFLQGVPWYEWDLSLPEAPELIRYFLHYIVELPEFQLA